MTEETWKLAILMIMIVLVPPVALAFPVVTYIMSVLNLRRQEILCTFNNKTLVRYFETFYPAVIFAKPKPNDEALTRKFEQLYSTSFGKRKFAIPTVLLLTLTTAFFIFTAHGIKPYLAPFLGSSSTTTLPSSIALIGFSGLAGGYMWVLFHLTKRVQERQLTPFDLYAGCSRIVICIPVSLALTAFFKGAFHEHALAAIAFMLGAFPMQSLLTFMRRTSASRLNLEQSFADQATTLTQLQGVGRDQAETFAKEGICTMLQLAYSDPVDITIRTGFSFSYTVDCCSQALAYLNFENDMPTLRRFGLRGALEMYTLILELSQGTDQEEATMDEEQRMAEKTMEVLANELHIDTTALRRSFYEIAFDPYTLFLSDVWLPDWT